MMWTAQFLANTSCGQQFYKEMQIWKKYSEILKWQARDKNVLFCPSLEKVCLRTFFCY